MTSKLASIRELLDAGVHLGHQAMDWNPKMRQYIYGKLNGRYIIDLEQTRYALDRACQLVGKAASDRKNIVFVGTKKLAATIIQEESLRCGTYYVNRRWLGGTLTNFETIQRQIRRLKELEEMRDLGELYRLPKKEQTLLKRELTKLEKLLGGLKGMRVRPDILIVIDQKRERIAIAEAKKIGITVIGLIDTNCNPDGVNYIIPGNDDSISAIRLVTRALADAILQGSLGSFDRDVDDDGPDRYPSGTPRKPHPTLGSAGTALALRDSEREL